MAIKASLKNGRKKAGVGLSRVSLALGAVRAVGRVQSPVTRNVAAFSPRVGALPGGVPLPCPSVSSS